MRVTIEGVETAKQADFVKQAEGDQAQGYFFGRPVPASEIAATILLDFQRSNKRPAPPVESDGQLRLIK
jgi:EAL domain-containing protein (putative c-di-GMP-specific phosphodiesterase class I)